MTGAVYPSPLSHHKVVEYVLTLEIARDIMTYEMFPLGPLNSKSLGTTMSAWIVTLEAMKPFRAPAPKRTSTPSPYLQYADESQRTGYTWELHADLITPDGSETKIAKVNMNLAYWTYKDMVAHQTINGCSLRTGDMLGTGTISGPTPDSRGCLLEVSKGGKVTFELTNGQKRTFIEDGDSIRMTGWAGTSEGSGVGFGECMGRIVPSPKFVAK